MKAYITLFSTDEYIYGLIGLMYSWKRTNPAYPFYVIVTPNISEYNKNILRKIGYQLIEKEEYVPTKYAQDLNNADASLDIGQSNKDWTKSGWHHCWTKLEIFGLTQFEKLVYLDSDTFVLQNMDDLFEKPGWSAPHETLSWIRGYPTLNSGLLVIEPNQEVYEKLIEFANNAVATMPGRLIADQDALNQFFPDWGKHLELALPYYYHANWYMFSNTKDNEHFGYVFNHLPDTRAIHMVGPKPWNTGKVPCSPEWEIYGFYQHYYVDYLNWCLKDLYDKSIAVLPIIK